MAYEATIPEKLLTGRRLGETRLVFEFEADFARDLRCIPMVVRFKLDRCGVKLSLRQWSRIGAVQRFALADRACDTESEAAVYRQALLQLIADCQAGDPVFLPESDTAQSWSDASTVAVRVAEMIAVLGLPPMNASAWAKLSTLQRFALLKLTRPGHDNENFLPAMREFGLCT
jgi:hypothetical protein